MMKKAMLAAASLLALTVSASAADLAPRPYTKAPPLPAPVAIWNGFYIGGFGGYGWSEEARASFAGFGVTETNHDLKGGFGGGTLGYNWQTPGSQYLFGIEVDAAGSDMHYSIGDVGSIKTNAFGSVTGRLGYVFNNALLYVKGGYGWANNKISILGVSETNFHSGWTVGAGFEYMFVPSWSFKAEYMYADYDKENYFSGIVPPGVDLGASFHTVKAGINYHFDWNTPFLARY